MSKRPSFQFYPHDWLTDLELRSCSLEARGFWIDLLCLMHDGGRYGYLSTATGPVSHEQLSKLLSIARRTVDRLLIELHISGVLSTSPEGMYFSRRMVRDEELRTKRASFGHLGAEHGSKGGRPKGFLKTPSSGYSENPPSSSSSSSSSSSKQEHARAPDPTTTSTEPEPRLLLPPQAWTLAKLHRELLLKHNPQSKAGGARWSAERWAKAYDDGQRSTAATPLDWELIRAALVWALDGSDPYWRGRVTSPGALFNSWDTITAQMNRPAGRDDGPGEYPDGYRPFPKDAHD